MKKAILIGLCVLSIICNGRVVHAGYDCSVSSVRVCMQPLRQFKTQTAVYEPNAMKKVCRAWDGAERCLRPYKRTCTSEPVRRMWKGLDDAMGYMCLKDTQAILAKSRCMEEPEVSRGMKQCARTMQSKMAATKEEMTNSALMGGITISKKHELMSELCNALNGYVGCIHSSLAHLCDKDTVRVMDTITTKILHSTASTIGCTLRQPGTGASGTSGVKQGFYHNRKHDSLVDMNFHGSHLLPTDPAKSAEEYKPQQARENLAKAERVLRWLPLKFVLFIVLVVIAFVVTIVVAIVKGVHRKIITRGSSRDVPLLKEDLA